MVTRHLPATVIRICSFLIAALSLQSTLIAQSANETRKLSIGDCIESALRHNLSLQASRIDPQIAIEETEVAQSEFDTALDLTVTNRVVQQSTSSSDLEGSDGPRNENFSARAALSKKVDTGASITLSTNAARLLTNSQFSTLNPAYDADVSVSVRQPLMDGFGTEVNRAVRQRSLIGVDRADFVLQANIQDIIRQTEISFYNLAFQRASMRVRLAARDVAQSFLDENTVRRENGMATSLDVTQAEVGLADQRALVLDSRQAVSDAEDLLLSLIGEFAFEKEVPELEVDLAIDEVPSVGGAYGVALKHQPEYRAALALSEQLRFDVILARSRSRARLDLGGALGYSGRDESFGLSYGGIPSGDGYAWQVDLMLRVPWGLREGKARLKQAELVLQREELRIRNLENDLMRDIRTAVRAVKTSVERVDIAQLRRRLSNEEYELEKAKFDAGLSTSRLVLEAQQRSDQTQVSELQANVGLKNAWSDLLKVQGISLSAYGIAMAPPAEPDSKSSPSGNTPPS